MKHLIDNIRKFAKLRDWEKFHTPKNLAMALSVEASEIVEIFQWLTEQESRNLDRDKLEALTEEIGDVQIYLLSLADKFGIDPIEAAKKKMVINNRKYPVEKVFGDSKKYTEY
jgi:NTP pyrophosphatase (non-canonical NTP hydrolase)